MSSPVPQQSPRHDPSGSRRLDPVDVAAWLTILSGAAFVVVAIVVLVVRQAVFSVGVSVMLALYGVLVLLVGSMLRRRNPVSFGAAVTCSLIHTLVLVNLAHANHAFLFGPLCLVPIIALVCLFTPAARVALGRR